MIVHYLKSKLHRATVTDANLEYEGSISIDSALMEAAHIQPFERVEVYNITNGERFATYAIRGEKGTICINGAAAWKAKPEDKVIIATYCQLTVDEARSFKPTLVLLAADNSIKTVVDDGSPH